MTPDRDRVRAAQPQRHEGDRAERRGRRRSSSPPWPASASAASDERADDRPRSRTTRGRRPSRAPSAGRRTPPRSSPGSSMRCQRGSGAWSSWGEAVMVPTAYARPGADPRPKSTRASTRRPWRRAARDADPAGHDRLRRPDQALRRAQRHRGRLLPLRARDRHRLPRTQRRRQDHDDARCSAGSPTPDAGRATVLGGHYRDLPNPGRRVGVLLDASAQHPGRRGREALAVSAQTIGVDARARRGPARARRTRPRRRRASACASTRWACASASGSRTRCSATPRS